MLLLKKVVYWETALVKPKFQWPASTHRRLKAAAIGAIKTINQPDQRRRPSIASSPLTGAPIMHLHSLFRSLLAAYAYGASGTYQQHADRPERD